MKDPSGSTALMSAAWNENKEIIETLLLANADPNVFITYLFIKIDSKFKIKHCFTFRL